MSDLRDLNCGPRPAANPPRRGNLANRLRVRPVLIALFVGTLAAPLYTPNALGASVASCDYYAAPAGEGDGSSPSTPFRIADFWSVASPGKTLCLLSGVYDEARSMVVPPVGVSGFPDSPITIKAVYDGGVLITGHASRNPLRLTDNDWFVVEGVNVCCSSGTVVLLEHSNHNIIRRVAAWDAADGNYPIFGVHYGDHNLLEDVAGWGIARKIYDSAQGGNFTTIRRAWGRWEGSHVVGPKMVYTLAYNNYDMLVENAIGTWSGEKMKQTYVLLDYNGNPWLGADGGTYTDYRVNQPYGIFAVDFLSGDKNARARLLGSLAYVGKKDRFEPDREVFFADIDSVEIKDTAAVFAPGGTYSGEHTFGLYGLTGGTAAGGETNLRALNLTSLDADSQGAQIGNGWFQSDIFHSIDVSQLKAGESAYKETKGANLCHQYLDGILTDRPLWPWPMNHRIADAMIQSGHASIDVTATIMGLFGALSGECAAIDLALPAAAHIKGVGGLEFSTDLHIHNPSSEPARAQLVFQNSTDGNRYETSVRLAPLQTANFEDVIASVFGLTGAVGALRLETDANGANTLRMTSRTYAKGNSGSFGEAVPGNAIVNVPRGQSVFVTGLVVSDGYRSNLGVMNTSPTQETFTIVLRDRTGAILGQSPIQTVDPGSQLQWSLHTLFPSATGKGLAAEFRPGKDNSVPAAYGSVIDSSSEDPTYYAAIRPAQVLYLPSVARIPGLGATLFLSDISLTNPDDAPITVTATFLERDIDNTDARKTTIDLLGHETRQMDDALHALFRLSGTYGALRLETSATSGLLASERIYTPSSTTPGTVGQQIDAVTPDRLFSNGSLLGLQQNAAFRTNVAFLNPDSSSASIKLTLLNANGDSLGTTSLFMPPLSYFQRSLLELFEGVRFPIDAPLTISVDSGGVAIFAFATTIDNTSNDPTFSPGLF